MTAENDVRRKKLRMRAWRRGTKELDLILGAFADRALPTMTDDGLDLFDRLLCEEDHDIYGWFLGRQETPTGYGEIIARLRAGMS